MFSSVWEQQTIYYECIKKGMKKPSLITHVRLSRLKFIKQEGKRTRKSRQKVFKKKVLFIPQFLDIRRFSFDLILFVKISYSLVRLNFLVFYMINCFVNFNHLSTLLFLQPHKQVYLGWEFIRNLSLYWRL